VRRSAFAASFLAPIAAAYEGAVLARNVLYRTGLLRSRRLGRPVISVGNLSVGGSGKTPLVAWLARLLLANGFKPAILTRGYRRKSGRSLVAIAPGMTRCVEPRATGDEPAWLAATLPEVPLVVCANRFRGGQFAEREFAVGSHVLDDGFQHLQLARDVDVVALDVTQNVPGGAMLPAGRLREPLRALARAQLVVLTRTELADAAELDQVIARIHPTPQVFRSRVKIASLVNVASGQRIAPGTLAGVPALAFCGVGNPQAFFADLEHWRFRIAGSVVFPDHHAYSAADTLLLSRRAGECHAEILLTTEKDVMNLPEGWKVPLEAFACAIEIEMLEPGAFENAVLARIRGLA
jgi:tetraacyldisaccharide 4'-kinase